MRPLSTALIVKGMVVFLAAATLAWLSASTAFVQVTRGSGAVGASDPVALNVRAKQFISTSNPKAADIARTSELARLSLKLQPLNPTALALSGLAQAATQRPTESKKLIQLSLLVSRRELLAHVANIEESASNDKADAALKSYDLALRTSGEAGGILFPVLASAVEDERIKQELVSYVNNRSRWVPAFTEFLLANNKNIDHFTEILLSSETQNGPEWNNYLSSTLIYKLIDGNKFDHARRYFIQRYPELKSILTSVAFSAENFDKRASGLGWQLTESPEFGAVRRSDGALDVFASSNVKGGVARKLLFLPAGLYTFVSAQAQANEDHSKHTQWLVYCRSYNTSDLIFDSLKASAPGNAGATFRITPECPVQALSLVVTGADSQQGTNEVVRPVRLAPNY